MKENENFIDAIQLKPIFDELQEFPIPQNSLNDGVHINKHDLVGSTRIVEALTESIKYLKNLIVAKDNKIEQISTEIDLYKNENLKKKEEVEKYKSKIMVEMQQSRFMEKKSSDIEIKLKNSIADKNEILEKLNFTTKKLCQTQKDHDFMIKCCQKIFQIFELPSDISLSEMIKIINTKEIEKKKLIDSCRNLSKKNFTLTENTNLLEFEMKEKDKQIFGLKSKLDDQQLATFVKEQQNIALQRQVDKANFADKNFYENI
ncbi:hypothetical protein HZS_5621 [Henneguya salminicola]|nr:hypothetical protein HZS_5621 [Henneguya salminicola]